MNDNNASEETNIDSDPKQVWIDELAVYGVNVVTEKLRHGIGDLIDLGIYSRIGQYCATRC